MFPGVCIAIPQWRDNGKQFSMRRSALMEPRTLQYMALAASDERLPGLRDALVTGVCTDSRHVQAGDLFIALRGDRFDGHDFLHDVARQSVAGVVAERGRAPAELTCAVIAVDNTRAALGRMAGRYRRDFNLPLVAVGGSNGKTTTKEILASVLRQKFKTLASKASFNNDIGVPTTLLELTTEHQAAILEFGTNHPGELEPLLRLSRPDYGVITSIGREHLEYFGDLDGVIREEGVLGEMLPASGKLFLNADTPGAATIMARSKAPVVKVGLNEGVDWRVTNLRFEPAGIRFAAETSVRAFNRDFQVPLLGRHQAVNSLLAIAVAAELGLAPEEVQRGLLACRPAKMRLQLSESNGVQILDDSYNANADSVRAALDTLQELPCAGRKVAVLGDMAELGAHAAPAHQEVGRHAAAAGIAHLVTVGKMAEITAAAAQEAGLASVACFSEVAEAAASLSAYLRPLDLVLLKASRATALERVGELIRAQKSAGAPHNQNRTTNPLGRR